MTDLEKQFESAVSAARSSVRAVSAPDPSTMSRRALRRTFTITTMAIVLFGLGTAGLLALVSSDGSVAGGDSLITSEMILEDGVVTETEYRAGAEAVVACLVAAGYDTKVNFDDPSRHASFWTDHADSQRVQAAEQFFTCEEQHLSYNVSLGWMAAMGQIDLDEERAEIVAVFGCVEAETGVDFGEVVYDQFGFRTEQGQLSYEAAFEHQDHEVWNACHFDLGYTADQQAETEAVFECVETKTGLDFGEIKWDEVGHLSDEGRAAENAAVHHQNNEVWETCQEELGIWPVSFGVVPDDFISED